MRNIFFLVMIIFLGFLSCRSGDDEVQRIDQVLQLYVDSADQNMLNPKIEGSYTKVSMNDIYGARDDSPVQFNLLKNADTITYIEYLASAVRIPIDSTESSKTYESKITVNLSKTVNDTVRTTKDTMTIQYRSTTSVFEISKVYYNNILEFTKVEGQPNVVKISK